jgi:S-adenosylmethionine:tRNA ribosyltransferase-isomerase
VHISDFDYELPDELIAQEPVEPRDSARLLVDGGDRLHHRHVRDLAELVRPGDVLVVNDTRVIPARLRLRRGSGGAVEVLLLEMTDGGVWSALVRPAAKLRPNEILLDEAGNEVATFIGRRDDGDTFDVRLHDDGQPMALLDRIGSLPLPPYITSDSGANERYQTVYSRRPASAAAPTAGLHFTANLLDLIQERGARLARVELVVGLDTFRPIGTDDPLQHQIHTELYSVPDETIEEVNRAERVIAVGTTAVRALESTFTSGRQSGRTNLFIHRGYEWKVVDLMMTNFHMPRTTLLMMIEAFVGPVWRDIYREAIERRYRFLSFGDAMLLDRHAHDH